MLTFTAVSVEMGERTHLVGELPKIGVAFQTDHALEIFTREKSSLALEPNGQMDLREFILRTVEASLPAKHKDSAFVIARSLIKEANHHQMDPFFLLAVIATESQFNVEARGSHGEIGLMQILPATAKDLAAQAGLKEDLDLRNPAVNIRIGATYLAKLRKAFKRKTKRYIAAYNMGSRNVRRLVANKVEPQIYPARVISNYTRIYSALNTAVSSAATRGVASSAF